MTTNGNRSPEPGGPHGEDAVRTIPSDPSDMSHAPQQAVQPEPARTADGVSLGEIERIVAGAHHDPHSILGAHSGPGGVVIRTLRPLAATVAVVLAAGGRVPMHHVHQ